MAIGKTTLDRRKQTFRDKPIAPKGPPGVRAKLFKFLKQNHVPAAIAAVVLIAAQTSVAAQTAGTGVAELTAPGKAFKQYLAESPPIKKIVYESSYAKGKYGPGVVWADGAIQPGGYFYRHLTNSPYTKNILVKGASTETEWEYFPEFHDVDYCPRTYWTNSAASMNYPTFTLFQTVARLGLVRPFPDHDGFTWISQTNFQFNRAVGLYSGSIVRFDGRGRPAELEYHSENKDPAKYFKATVVYHYDTDQDFPPSKFVVDFQHGDDHAFTTNTIHALELGLNDHAENGYYMKEFIPEQPDLNQVYFLSNHVRYEVLPDGSKRLYKYPNAVETSLHPVRYAIFFVLLATIITITVYLVRWREKDKIAPIKPKNEN